MQLLAGVACLLFILGLRDTRVRSEPLATPTTETIVVGLRIVARSNVPEAAAASPNASPPPTDVRFFREQQGHYEYVAQLTTDPSGTATARVPPGDYWVIARAPRFARLTLPLEIRADRSLLLTLEAARRLAVTVRNDGGESVSGAAVLVTAADRLPFGGSTDGAGRLVLDALGSGPYAVRVLAPGYEPFETTTSQSELEVRLRRASALRVVVRDEQGNGVADAEVQLSGARLWPTRRVSTNAEGQVVISGLAAGTYEAFAQQGSRVSDVLYGIELGYGSEPVHTVELVLRPGRFLSVEVVDVEGKGIADADLLLTEAGVAAFPRAARSDAHGRARLGPLRWHQAHLAVRADGFVPRSLWVGSEALDSAEPLRVELIRGGTIVGRVVDERGFPVEGVALEVIGTDLYGMPVALTPDTSSVRKAHFSEVLKGPAPLIPAGELGVMPGPVPPIPLVGSGVASTLQGRWTTDGRGQFTARGVSPGELRVLARHPDYVESVSDPVRLGPGGEAEVEVVLRAGRRIEGRLLDAQGFPVAQARVRLQATKGAFDRTLLTRTDGTFAVAAAPKELVVSVFDIDEPLRVVLRRAVVLSDDPNERLELELPEARADVRFEVLDDRDEPVAVAQVTVLSLDPEVPLRETRFSADDGSLELSAAAGIHARVLVDTPGFARLDRVLPALPETVRLKLSRAVTVTGRVTTVRGRQPAVGAQVTLRGDGIRRQGRTDASGEFTIRDVPAGRIHVTAEHPELGRAFTEVEVVRLDHDRPFEIPPLDLVELATVSGRVVDRDGSPVVGARVAVGVVPAYLPQGVLPSGMAMTDSQGEFTLVGVEPGRHTLSALAPTVGRGSVANVQLEPGEERRDLVIVLTQPLGEDGHDWRGGVAVTLGERDTRRGTHVVVVHVAEGSEAERAGLLPGDVLTHVDGVAVSDMAEARQRLGGPAGSDVVLVLLRDGKTVHTRVTREAVSR